MIMMEKKNSIFNSRNLKYGSNSVILIVAVVAIAVLVNVIVGMGDLKLDLTPNKLYSLSDVSRNELKNLKQEVQIIGLFDEVKADSSTDMKEVTELLNLYAKYPNVKIQYVDPDKNPGIIKQLDPDNTMDLQSQDFVVKSKVNGMEKKKKLGYYDLFQMEMDQQSYQYNKTGSNAEQGFTGAIKYVTSEKTPVVYFTSNHSEIDVDSQYSNLKSYLEKNNFLTKKLDLLTVSEIPKDAELLVIAAPRSDLTMPERDKLEAYFSKGGKAIFMFDYLASDPTYDNFNALLSKFNVAVDYDKVKENDENRHLPNDQYTIVLDVPQNEIVPQEFKTLLENSRSISILKNTKEYITTTPIMSTSSNAVGEMVTKSRGEDLKGPLDIAVAVENKGGEAASKILVMGNASFIGNDAATKYGDYYTNSMAFFLQSMSWMIGKQDEIIVPTKNYEVNTLQISQLQTNIMGGVLVVVFPLLILGTGLAVFLRRRHL